MAAEERRFDRVVALWQVNESLLQSYRGLSLATQSFLLAVGAIVATSRVGGTVPGVAFGIIATVGLVHLGWIWMRVVRPRGLIADYYKYQITCELSEARMAELKAFCPEGRFLRDADRRRAVWRDYFGQDAEGPSRLTRLKLDLVVPMLFAVVWLALTAIKLLAPVA